MAVAPLFDGRRFLDRSQRRTIRESANDVAYLRIHQSQAENQGQWGVCVLRNPHDAAIIYGYGFGRNHKSGDAWVRIASSAQSRTFAPSFFNAPPAETARWKRCVPRFAPINALIAQAIFSHTLQLIINSHYLPALKR